MTDSTVLRARTPDDLLALVPRFLGFHPEDSLVVVSVGQAGRAVHARVDLPPPEHLEAVCAHLAGVAERGGVVAVAVVLYTDDGPHAVRATRALDRALGAVGCEVVVAVRADGSRWWALGTPEADGPGTAYDLSTHPMTVDGVVEGRVVLPSRDALVASLAPDPDAVLATTRWVVETVHDLYARVAERRDLVTEGRWVRHRVRRFLENGLPLDASELARLVLMVHRTVEVRDVAWAEMDHASALRHVALWSDVVRRTPAELLAAPATLLAFAAWLSGHGALAWCGVELAQQADPDYSLAALLAHVLGAGLPPHVWEPLGEEHLTLFET